MMEENRMVLSCFALHVFFDTRGEGLGLVHGSTESVSQAVDLTTSSFFVVISSCFYGGK